MSWKQGYQVLAREYVSCNRHIPLKSFYIFNYKIQEYFYRQKSTDNIDKYKRNTNNKNICSEKNIDLLYIWMYNENIGISEKCFCGREDIWEMRKMKN